MEGPTAIVFCGLQGSGKSTFFAQRFADTHVRLNLDMLRTRKREDILLHACLAAQQSFVADNTNPLPGQRRRYAALARAAGFQVQCYYFDSTVAQAIARNQTRAEAARGPELAIRGTAAKLLAPTSDEGFDRLYRVTITKQGEFVVEAAP